MSSDEIPENPPRRMGVAEIDGAYEAHETWRQTGRALVMPLGSALALDALRAAYARLNEVAEQQRLAIVEEPMFGLKGDPSVDPPHAWEYEAVLPIRGAARPDGDVMVARIEGGMHIASLARRGLDELNELYAYLFEKLLPAKKQRLMRPYILHRVRGRAGDPDSERDDAVAVAVYVPAVLSLKPVPVPDGPAEA